MEIFRPLSVVTPSPRASCRVVWHRVHRARGMVMACRDGLLVACGGLPGVMLAGYLSVLLWIACEYLSCVVHNGLMLG
jgi:predicted Rossmann-fold nucleotide-binding protein